MNYSPITYSSANSTYTTGAPQSRTELTIQPPRDSFICCANSIWWDGIMAPKKVKPFWRGLWRERRTRPVRYLPRRPAVKHCGAAWNHVVKG